MSAPPESLSDRDLLASLRDLVAREREVEADLIAHLVEVDARQLHVREGFPSLFQYCIEELHLSESVAYHRIKVARAARTHPVILDHLRSGAVHVSGLRELAPHLTVENHLELLHAAKHKSRREILEILADRKPKPDAPSSMRLL